MEKRIHKLDKQPQETPSQKITKTMINRIRFLLKVAYVKRVDVLILGAFGCGCFGNDANVVFHTYRYLLDTEFKNSFFKVVFPIPDKKMMDNIVIPYMTSDEYEDEYLVSLTKASS